jgi:hypothetical protein
VEVEVDKQKSAVGNSIRLNLIAYDAFTGRLIGSKTTKSDQMATEQFDRLVEQALKKTENGTAVLILEDFLNIMQIKFDDIVQNGRPVKIIFGVGTNSSVNYDTEIGTNNYLLRDEIIDWIEKNAYKGNAHSQNATSKQLIFDEVRIPIKDEKNQNFTPNKFARQIRAFCNSITLANDVSIKIKVVDEVRGGTIYITLK